MKVVYHPSVQRDVSRILRHYDSINDRLGDDFWNELNALINQAPLRIRAVFIFRVAGTAAG